MCENKVFDVHIQKLLKFLIHLSGLIYCAIYNVWVDVLSGKEGGVYMIMTSPLAIASLIKIYGAVIFQSKSVPYTIDQKCMYDAYIASLYRYLPGFRCCISYEFFCE